MLWHALPIATPCVMIVLTWRLSQALKAGAEEYSRILDLLGRYAVFKEGVAFSCKKQVRLDCTHAARWCRVLESLIAVLRVAVAAEASC